ncbi:hypothetical protein U9M48_016515, partial [Paspalum notatum var. saurae]
RSRCGCGCGWGGLARTRTKAPAFLLFCRHPFRPSHTPRKVQTQTTHFPSPICPSYLDISLHCIHPSILCRRPSSSRRGTGRPPLLLPAGVPAPTLHLHLLSEVRGKGSNRLWQVASAYPH